MKTPVTLLLLSLATLLSSQTPRLIVPIGHTKKITALAFSPDGKYILTGSEDKTAKLWDLQGHEIQTFRGHTEQILALAFAPDGNSVLSVCADNTIRIWDLAGKEIRTFGSTHEMDQVNVVAFSADGKYVLTGKQYGTVSLWSTETGKETMSFQAHNSGISAVAISRDGQYILTGSMEDTGRPNPDAASVMGGARTISEGVVKRWNRNSGQVEQTINTGRAAPNTLAFSPDGNILAGLTGAAKCWDLQGRETRTFDCPEEGSLHYAAFSVNGKQVLTAGYRIKLWDASGKQSQDIGDAGACAFSPDNKHILWCDPLTEGTAKLLDFSGKVVQTYGGYSKTVSALAVSAANASGGRTLLMGIDGSAKLMDLAAMSIKPLAKPFPDYYLRAKLKSMAFSPDGKYVLAASGAGCVARWTMNGDLKENFPCPFIDSGDPFSVAISPAGPRDPVGGEYILRAGGSSGTVLELMHCPTSEITRSFTLPGAEPPPNNHDPSAETEQSQMQQKVTIQPDFSLDNQLKREIETAKSAKFIYTAIFSPDGKNILSGDTYNAILWDLNGNIVQTFGGLPAEIANINESSSMEEKRRANELIQTIGVPAVAFSPDGQSILTGNRDGTAKIWSRNGQLQQTFKGHTASVFQVAFSPADGRKYVLTGSRDNTAKLWAATSPAKPVQTYSGHSIDNYAFSPDGKFVLGISQLESSIIFWDTQSGKELATLVIIDSLDWAVTTPSGLFDASPGAMNLMHFIVGKEVIELEQLKKRYWEPGLLAQIMDQKPLRDVSAFSSLPLYPEIEASITGAQLQVKLKVRSGGMGKLSLLVNDKEVAENINPEKKTTLDVDLSQFDQFYLDSNTITLRAFIEGEWLKSRAYELPYLPVGSKGGPGNNSGAATTPTRKPGLPHLYAIVVGTSKYNNAKLKLRFPDLDAEAMAKAIQAAGARLFDDRVHVQLLSTADKQTLADKNNIKAAFETYKGQAKAGDILVVYFSGHGITYGSAESSQFYYLTKDVPGTDLSDPEVRKNYTVSSGELTTWVKAIPAQKQVLIFDACNSGSVAEAFDPNGAKEFSPSQIRAYDEMKDRTGTFILAGAAADKVSFEASEYGQGLLTYSLLEGMSGLALLDDKRVDVMKLFQHARTTVPNLAKGINKVQTPMMAFPAGSGGSGESFSIGRVDAQAKMPPLKPVKPVYIKPLFVDVDAGEDGLELVQALADFFDEQTALGADAPLVYVPVDKYENGYKISGTYKTNGETTEVSGILKKGATKIGDFKASGKKNDVKGLVESIIEKVAPLIK